MLGVEWRGEKRGLSSREDWRRAKATATSEDMFQHKRGWEHDQRRIRPRQEEYGKGQRERTAGKLRKVINTVNISHLLFR